MVEEEHDKCLHLVEYAQREINMCHINMKVAGSW